MNGNFQMGVLMLCIVFFNLSIQAQTKEWKNAKTKDGKISTKYYISTRSNEIGEKVPLIESVTTSTEKIGIEKCISLMKNVSKHKDFHGDNSSKLITTISENQWVVYYYTEGTKFSPNSDGVYAMTFTEDKLKKTAAFTLNAEPTLYEKKDKDVKRVTYSNEVLTFKDLGNSMVEITMTAKMSPAFPVPAWIMKMSFPEPLFEVMKNFIKLAYVEPGK